ncbi:MAG TPA: DUF4062 domain-containing protein [Prosthecobacter sp.]|nr:DUF4062 domain-containing protein [Prosthecobacter sp.]
MADFVRKKLQVFVSSTYTDLIFERQAAVSAILSAGHIPAGMELFTAGDESQMDVIKQWIDESDVFMLILGGRYGSLEPTSGKSYTHLEYEYAAAQNKPLFACVVQEAALEERVKVEGTSVIEITNASKLANFRDQVLGKLCKFWEDTKDIKIAVTETLAHIARREELVGWVRASKQTDLAALLNEMTRLSNENAGLRADVGRFNQPLQINGLLFPELKVLLEKSGAIRSLLGNRTALARKAADVSGRDRDELIQRGLIERTGPTSYGLTAEGRMFLNRYDFEAMEVPSA